MNYRKVHEYIWDAVIKDLGDGLDGVTSMKKRALRQLLYGGEITEHEYDELVMNNKCVLCLLFGGDYKHFECPLFKYNGKGCSARDAPWQKVVAQYSPLRERIEAAEVIRNIMRDTAYEEGA